MTMKTLKIRGRVVSIDTEKLSKGICEMHETDDGMKTMLAFGMLDARLMEHAENGLAERIKKELKDGLELYLDEINKFIKDCNNEIAIGVYKYATMVV